jgi:hypothetical protein
VVLIDSGSTHNFVHCTPDDEIHCFVYHVSNFQILIADGGIMKCGGHCENVKLQMGDYHLKTHMFPISMGGCDIVLGMEWLHTLGPITLDYQKLYIIFTQEAHPSLVHIGKMSMLYLRHYGQNWTYCRKIEEILNFFLHIT